MREEKEKKKERFFWKGSGLGPGKPCRKSFSPPKITGGGLLHRVLVQKDSSNNTNYVAIMHAKVRA